MYESKFNVENDIMLWARRNIELFRSVSSFAHLPSSEVSLSITLNQNEFFCAKHVPNEIETENSASW